VPMEWIPGNPNDRSVTGFRIRHGSARGPMSRRFYYEMKKSGLAPVETTVNKKVIITAAAEADWEAARTNPTGTEARLQAKAKAQRVARAKKAGQVAAASPNHVSKRRRGKR